MHITFVTIAQNEQAKIAKCIESARGLGEHLVIDGGSLDDTVSTAEAMGCRVLKRPYKYSADQYNYGLSQVKTPWAFILDADETLSEALRRALTELADVDDTVAAFEVSRLNLVWGRPLRHGGWYPDFNARLLRVGRVRYQDREVHARLSIDGELGRLNGDIVHATYDSVDHYLTKLNRFTTRELSARDRANSSTETVAAKRELWLRSPFKPATKFLYQYLAKQGFRDGRLGLDMAILSAFYEYIVGVKKRSGSAAGSSASVTARAVRDSQR